jgi:hypothetical protein
MAVIGSQLYSFHYTVPVFGTVFQPGTPAAGALAAIENQLTEGRTDFLAGQYQQAIGAYRQAASLIYGQLYPPAAGGTSPISLDPQLFQPVLSLGLEWMNMLTPTLPVAAARPRLAVTPGLAGQAPAAQAGKASAAGKAGKAGKAAAQAAVPPGPGLHSVVIDQQDNASATADWQYAQMLYAQANIAAAKFFHDRAQKTAPKLVGELDKQPGAWTPTGGNGCGDESAAAEPPAPSAEPSAMATAQAAGPTSGPSAILAMPSVPAPEIARAIVPAALTVDRTYAVQQGDTVATLTWPAGGAPSVDEAIISLYQARVTTTSLALLLNAPTCPADLAAGLPHIYFYVIPLAGGVLSRPWRLRHRRDRVPAGHSLSVPQHDRGGAIPVGQARPVVPGLG